MRRTALLVALVTVALVAPSAEAMCAIPGVYPLRTWAQPGETVRIRLIGGRGQQCQDTIFPGQPSPPEVVTRVTVYLSRPAQRVPLATVRQRGYGHEFTARIPAGTAEGPWIIRTDSELRTPDTFRVGAPPALPRTGSPLPPLAAVGTWLAVAGTWNVAAARPRRRRPARPKARFG